jgi:DNA-binding XRE family transcriptional regulator
MANLGSVLREEITRLSKRASRSDLDAIRKSAAQHRRQIAALRRDIGELARHLKQLLRERSAAPVAVANASDGKRTRFVAKGLRPQRERLALSRAEFGQLVGVSAQSIYQWERGAVRPRTQQLAALAALRGIGKREAHRRLAQLAQPSAKKRRNR